MAETQSAEQPLGANYDKKSGSELMTVTVYDLDDPSKNVTFIIDEDKGLTWDQGTMCLSRVISIAQPHEGNDGTFHLGSQWTGSTIFRKNDTGQSSYYWSDIGGIVFESYPTQKTKAWTRVPVVTTTPAQSQAKNMEAVSIDARP